MSGVQDTSLEVYHDEVKPNIGQKQKEVLFAVSVGKRPVCNQEIANYLDRPINQITPRMNELVKLGKVEEAFRDIYPATNRRVIYWRVKK